MLPSLSLQRPLTPPPPPPSLSASISEILSLQTSSSIPSMSTIPLLGGRWSLLYSSTDPTRSSPFFPAFSNAFGAQQAEQIFKLTDSIPSGIKDVEDAYQTISFDPTFKSGELVSRVKVTAFGGASESIMTTRTTFEVQDAGGEVSTLSLKVGTTKPEKSTVVSMLPGFLKSIADSAPPFPSGSALEAVKEGASGVDGGSGGGEGILLFYILHSKNNPTKKI